MCGFLALKWEEMERVPGGSVSSGHRSLCCGKRRTVVWALGARGPGPTGNEHAVGPREKASPVTQRLPCSPEAQDRSAGGRGPVGLRGRRGGGTPPPPSIQGLLCRIQTNERISHCVAGTGGSQFLTSFWEEATQVSSWKHIPLINTREGHSVEGAAFFLGGGRRRSPTIPGKVARLAGAWTPQGDGGGLPEVG